LEAVHCDANLLEIVHALRAIGRFARFLHGGHQERNENGNDRDHDQQFDERERETIRVAVSHGTIPSPVLRERA